MYQHRKQILAGCMLFFAGIASSNAASVDLIINGSFETGDFTGWQVKDINPPFYPLSVRMAGTTPGFGLFTAVPTNGRFMASHGFDGGGPGTIEISQDVIIPPGFDATLTFDWRAGWNYFSFNPIPRTFDVVLENPTNGTVFLSRNLQTANFSQIFQVEDSNPRSESMDISSLAGNNVRVKFIANIPQSFTGPGHLQLDNVRLDIVRRDADLDGVLDEIDLCPNTLVPESIARDGLKPNHYALIDNDGTFDTQEPYGGGKGNGKSYTTVQTQGCSCEQIVEKQKLGKGLAKFGCTSGVMDTFIKSLN